MDRLLTDEERKLHQYASRTGGDPDYVTGFNWNINGLLEAQDAKTLKAVGEFFGQKLDATYNQPFTQIYKDEIEALKRGEFPDGS